MPRYTYEEKDAWRWWVTPKSLREEPIHRWYVFPHSFTRDLIHALIDEWGLGAEDHILDPFVGAGTTVLAAKEKDIPATGYDLSPLAVFAARAKTANYNIGRLETLWGHLSRLLNPAQWNGAVRVYPELVQKALPGRLLGAFDAIDRSISSLDASRTEKDFFRLALLTTIPQYSRAVASGGWLKWVKKQNRISSIPSSLGKRIGVMLEDLQNIQLSRRLHWRVNIADARAIPDKESTYSAVITSPPYPNRHDYTRVFGVELMFAFLDWEETRQLRYQSFHSHPEAKPNRPDASDYVQPSILAQSLTKIKDNTDEPRIPAIIEGYFLDMYLCLREVKRVCKLGARIAFVLGNAQYCGVPVPVDEITAELGGRVGLQYEKIVVARYRGNSAQQMGKYGRNPSRESVVVFRKV